MLNRYSFAIILLLLLSSITATVGQRITLDVENVMLREVFSEIEKQCDYTFSYSGAIDVNQKVTYTGTNTLKATLDEILSPLGLQYQLIEQQLIIKPIRPKPGGAATIRGYIKDKQNGEALIGASVLIQGTSQGVISNPYGFYSLQLPHGEYQLVFSFVGYESIIQPINLYETTDLNVSLSEEPPVLEEIVVTASQTALEDIEVGRDKVSAKRVNEMPALFGEMDVVKSLEFVPGIKSHSDGSTFMYIRGGHRDQNLLMIDDAPIFNASHLLGVFSTIIPDAINSIDIYKGNMPASMGGRLSSVIDIRTKKGNDQQFEFWGNSGIISSKLGVEGPIKKDYSSYLLSGRISRIKWIFDNDVNDLDRLNFYDLTAKLNFKTGAKDNIYFTTYVGEDNFFANNSGIEWSNLAGSLRWNHIFGDNVFMNATAAGSTYDYFLHTDVANNTQWKSKIATFVLKGDFTYFKSPSSIFNFGLSIGGYNFNPGNLSTDDPNVSPPLVSIRNAFETNLYGEHEVKLSDKLGLKYGLRLTSWTNQGDAFEFVYDENRNPVDTLFFQGGEDYNDFGNAEPRLALTYLLNEKSSLKFGYARNVQNVHLISNSISPFTSLEVWLPSSLNIQPQISDQLSLGYSRFFKSGVQLTTEAYVKRMQNQIDYEPHAETLLNPLLEGELRFGDARAYGLEVLLKRDFGRLRGWAGYTYSRAFRQFDEINNGEEYNAFFDRPHEINIVASYDVTPRLNLGLNWTYYSGSPFSQPIGFYKFNGLEAPVYGEKNNARLPDYHRLDASVTYKLNKNPESRWQHDLSFSLYNIYGRRNTLFINYNKVPSGEDQFRIPSNLFQAERVSTQYYLFQFTPSLTYNFRFR